MIRATSPPMERSRANTTSEPSSAASTSDKIERTITRPNYFLTLSGGVRRGPMPQASLRIRWGVGPALASGPHPYFSTVRLDSPRGSALPPHLTQVDVDRRQSMLLDAHQVGPIHDRGGRLLGGEDPALISNVLVDGDLGRDVFVPIQDAVEFRQHRVHLLVTEGRHVLAEGLAVLPAAV